MKPIKNITNEELIKESKKFFNNFDKDCKDPYLIFQYAFIIGCNYMREKGIKENSKLRIDINRLKSIIHQYKRDNIKLSNIIKKLKRS